MIFLISYTYTEPTTGRRYPGLHYIQSADTPGEAAYFFEARHPNSIIDVNNITEVK